MKILDRYIGSTVATHVAIVMVVLLALYGFSAFVAEMSDVGKGSYTPELALTYVAMLIPRQIYQLFPLAALLGTMLGLGALANTSELTVMRAAGISVRRIVISVLKVGILMVLLATVLGEVVAPPLEMHAQLQRARALSAQISLNAKDGLWARDGLSFINIKRLFSDGRASEIHVYTFNAQHQLRQVIVADRGVYTDQAWQLSDVSVSRVAANGTDTLHFDNFRLHSSLTPAVIDVVALPPENLSIADLIDYLRYMRKNGLEDRRYDLALWIRMMTPLATAGMVLLAIPFVFGSMRSVGIGQRIMIGALIGIGFYLFNAIFSRVGVVYSIPPEVAASLPTLLVFGAWYHMMRRIF